MRFIDLHIDNSLWREEWKFIVVAGILGSGCFDKFAVGVISSSLNGLARSLYSLWILEYILRRWFARDVGFSNPIYF